jgi:GTP pyrophosphokinase
MKTGVADSAPARDAATIVRVAQVDGDAQALPGGDAQALGRARAFAEPLLAGRLLDTGEDALAHADGVAQALREIGAAPALQAAAYLVYAGDHLQKPDEVIANAFGTSYASLVSHTRKLVQIQRAARAAAESGGQTERVRKMLLAFSRDLRVVLLRLASRLQTLRWYAASKQPCPPELARESQQVFAPLANRLGIWQVKWELEDLAFRFLAPDDYRHIARLLHETRREREAGVEAFRERLAAELASAGVVAQVQGRPKHLWSIWKKMQGKQLAFAQVLDVRALRVIVPDVPACYAALAHVHARWQAVHSEFDDYIARPKPNGYQSLHTVVLDEDGRAVEVQIRTRAMHEHAEFGVAAHWAYKEAGARGYAGVAAGSAYDEQLALARKAVLRQLLAWERDTTAAAQGGFDDRIYVFTPQAAVVELPVGGTPVDFAYTLHTDLGHRCRGAKVDGQIVPLNTRLQSGQTVEVTCAKEGGPSLDWLNADLGYLASARARAKVRSWFNAQAQHATIARGRELVEKLLQREGKTALKLDELAVRLGFREADALFEVVGKDEYSLRHIEQLLRPPPAPEPDDEERLLLKRARSDAAKGGVLVVGVDSLLTSLARCCRPAPPDAIAGYVTRGKGVAVHRRSCSNLRHMQAAQPERVIDVAWGGADTASRYPIDLIVEAMDRPGLLRDLSEVFAKEKMNVTALRTQPGADGLTGLAFTVELADTARLAAVLALAARVPGVRQARRR